MASTAKPDPEYAPPPPKAEPSGLLSTVNCSVIDVALRVLLFASTLTSIIVLVTSKQTVRAPLPLQAKFQHTPAFIYFLVALSVSGLYGLITTLASISIIKKPEFSTKYWLFFVLGDVLILGILASATGTAGGIAYLGLKGNDHVRWQKVCNVFDKFCRHIGGSIAVSLFASVLLVLLVFLSIFSIHKRIPK
ncbi:hypothetical protein UlMin_009505 [Ulmus minor]